jgi:hypothetical protein
MFHDKNQTDQGDKAKGFEEGRIRNRGIGEGVKRLFTLKPNLRNI